jgi:hypothetical protein
MANFLHINPSTDAAKSAPVAMRADTADRAAAYGYNRALAGRCAR